MPTIEDKVRKIITDRLGINPEDITLEAAFMDDLGADSLDTVELAMAFEEEFDMKIPDEDIEKIVTVGDAIEYIKEHKGNAS